MALMIKLVKWFMTIKKALLGLLILFSIQSHAETSLLCTGDGRTVYASYVLAFNEDDVIADFAHKDVSFNVVYDDNEFVVASSSGGFPGGTIYQNFVANRVMQFNKDKDWIWADSNFSGPLYDYETYRIHFNINRFNGKFSYLHSYTRSENPSDGTPIESWEETYGIGTDKHIKIKGTCKVHKLAF
jgi:hypothetical protein